MTLPRLHRRLAVLMALAALAAFVAGAGWNLLLGLTALALGAALLWQPPPAAGAWVERLGWAGALLLFGWTLYVAFAAGGDYLPPTLGLLVFLLVVEAFRPLAAASAPSSGIRRYDLRLYALSFALLIAATAYYPGIGFAAAFIAYIGLATLALMVGHLRREGERYGIGEIPLRRSFLVATAALSALTVLVSALVFLAFPRLPRGWIGATRAAGQTTMVGFGEGVSLGQHGGRIYPNPEIAFRVEFDGPPPADVATLHWRGRSYDHFDGVRWTRSRGLPPSAPSPNLYWERWRAEPARQYRIYGGPPGVRVLFGLHPVVDVLPHTPMRPWLDATGDLVYAGGDAPVYDVRSAGRLPGEAALRAARGPEPPAAAHYLQLPPLSPRVGALADSLVRGQPTRYDAARAVEGWLRTHFGYTLELPATARETSVEHFLFERRQGHCEYFSTAMVVLLRAAGIPARNVTGFLGGEWNASAGYLAVTQNDAHSWVEVWFPGLGWVPFDPTPPAGRNRVAGPGASRAWSWPLQFWLDGLQHRWYKWVLYYDLDKQLTLARRAASAFAGPRPPLRPPAAGGRAGAALPWLLGGALVLGLVWILRPARRAPRRARAETRLYLALRAAYRRAGFAADAATGPLAWLERLHAADAPALDAAEEAVRLYLRARFGGEEIGPEGHRRLAAAVAAAKRALRAAPRAAALARRGL